MIPKNFEEILSHQVSGLHQYVLNDPVHLSYVSQNLCEMVGVNESELLNDSRDLYAQLVHPADRDKYNNFISRLAEQEQTLTEEYRLIKKDGNELYVRDTAVSKKSDDGIFTGISFLTDITDLKSEIDDMQFLNETIHCGFLRYTCEKQPKITYINQRMIELLRFPEADEDEIDDLEMYKSNIFLMIPVEERRRFAKYLQRVYSANKSIAGETTLLRCDGTRVHIFGWVTKCVNEQGEEEFQSVCMDITERYQARKDRESMRYLNALTDVYDMIFEFNLYANTVKCLHSRERSFFKKFENIAMNLEDALERWILVSIEPGDQESVRNLFHQLCRKSLYEDDDKPPQISYKARSTDGSIRDYTGVFIKIDDAVSFYCCRELQEVDNTVVLKNENYQQKEGMRNLVMRFSDGIAAFELSREGAVKPLYASENVWGFFGYTKEEWLSLTKTFTPLKKFTAYSETSYEEFTKLLNKGEAEFVYFDYKTGTERKIKAVCSRREPTGAYSRYVMLYAVEDDDTEVQTAMQEEPVVSIRTFGYFDVFVGDKPIAFRSKKAKELLALLVDRRGGYVTSDEAIGFLWEDEPTNSVTLARYRKVALRLKNTLEEYGISDVIENVDGKRRIVMEHVQCDLYNYISGEEEYSNLFKGSYLNNYSWAETTLGELISNQEQRGLL